MGKYFLHFLAFALAFCVVIMGALVVLHFEAPMA
jgi:hypothetical protein